jgi:hypothetical protein
MLGQVNYLSNLAIKKPIIFERTDIQRTTCKYTIIFEEQF